jgi:hypothetical protein
LAIDFALLDANSGGDLDEEEEKEIEMILRKGLYYIFNDEPDELNNFCMEDINKSLRNKPTS